MGSPTATRKTRYNRNQRVSPQEQAAILNAQQLQQAQIATDNNLAIANELSKRGTKDAGLLARAGEISHIAKSATPGSYQANRVSQDRLRLMQDAGYNTSAAQAQPAFTANQERASLRKSRRKVGG